MAPQLPSLVYPKHGKKIKYINSCKITLHWVNIKLKTILAMEESPVKIASKVNCLKP